MTSIDYLKNYTGTNGLPEFIQKYCKNVNVEQILRDIGCGQK